MGQAGGVGPGIGSGVFVILRRKPQIQPDFVIIVGHGKEPLSSRLAALNVLAFLYHTFLSFTDANYRLIRAALPTRKIFFDDLRALTRYRLFPNCTTLFASIPVPVKLTDCLLAKFVVWRRTSFESAARGSIT